MWRGFRYSFLIMLNKQIGIVLLLTSLEISYIDIFNPPTSLNLSELGKVIALLSYTMQEFMNNIKETFLNWYKYLNIYLANCCNSCY